MPTTRKAKATKAKTTKTRTAKQSASTRGSNLSKQSTALTGKEAEEMAYERLLRQVMENRKKKDNNEVSEGNQNLLEQDTNSVAKRCKQNSPEDIQSASAVTNSQTEDISASVNIEEDGMIIDMSLAEVEKEFTLDPTALHNNNANIGMEQIQSCMGVERSSGAVQIVRPALHDDNPGNDAEILKTIGLMQDYMLKKGLIKPDLSGEKLNEFLLKESQTSEAAGKTNKGKTQSQGRESIFSSSEVTIYKQAIQTLNPELNAQIEDLLNKSRGEVAKGHKVSYSSDENMDTSDETIDAPCLTDKFTAVHSFADTLEPGTSTKPTQRDEQHHYEPEKTPEEQAYLLIGEAERSKARIFDVPGIVDFNAYKSSVAAMDKDYQMIDAHIDDALKRKVLNFEYVNFSKLMVCNKPVKEDDHQRLEIINKNGMSFLSPISDRDNLNVSSYSHWEQAFRVFSNIITSKYPQKSSELLQYNHTIHTASVSYIWENVYAYDHEFRQHIA